MQVVNDSASCEKGLQGTSFSVVAVTLMHGKNPVSFQRMRLQTSPIA